MQPSVPWHVLAIAALTWLLGLPSAVRQWRDLWRTLLVGGAIVAVGYVATLGVAPPFHRGQGLGCGFALGAAAATLALLPALRMGAASAASRIMACGAAVAPSVAATALVYVLLPSVRVDALTGVFIGWAVAAAVLCRTTGVASAPAARTDALLVTTVFTGALSLLLILTVYKARELSVGYRWATLALTVAATGLLALVAAAPLASRLKQAATTAAGAAAALVVGVVGAQLIPRMAIWLRIEDAAHDLALTVLAGCAGGLVLGSFVAARRSSPVQWEMGLAALIGVAIAAPGLHLLVATGAGLAILAAMFPLMAMLAADAAAADAPDHEDRRGSGSLLTMAAVLPVLALLAVRVLGERFGSTLSRPGSAEHFQVAALVLGVTMPIAIASVASRRPALASRAATVLLSVLWPPVVAVLWGPTVVAPLVIGLGLSALMTNAATSTALALVSMAAMVQLAPVAVHMNSLTRVERAELVLAAGAACIAAYLCSFGADVLRRTKEG